MIVSFLNKNMVFNNNNIQWMYNCIISNAFAFYFKCQNSASGSKVNDTIYYFKGTTFVPLWFFGTILYFSTIWVHIADLSSNNYQGVWVLFTGQSYNFNSNQLAWKSDIHPLEKLGYDKHSNLLIMINSL